MKAHIFPKLGNSFPRLLLHLEQCLPRVSGVKSHDKGAVCFIDPRRIQIQCFNSSLDPHRKPHYVPLSDRNRGNLRLLSTSQEKLTLHRTFENQPPSWLFVSNAVAGAYGAQVNVDLDLDRRLAPGPLLWLRENVEARGMSLDVQRLASLYTKFKAVEGAHNSLGERKHEILRQLKQVEDKQAKDSLVAELRQIKKDIKSVTKELWDFEEELMIAALRLPNELHSTTPLNEIEVKRETHAVADDFTNLTHVEVARKYGLIKFSNVGPKAYYLKSQLAKAEILLTDLAHAFFHRLGYRLVSGPEFFKTPVMEGCGHDVYDTDKVLTMQHTSRDIEPLLHLAGISPMTFAAYLARLNIGSSSLPLRLFSIGRRYQEGSLPGLFGAAQSTQVGLFSCVSQDQLENEFDHMAENVWNFLEPFGFHIRLCNIRARDLQNAEKRKVEVQMFSPSLNDFIPVACVSDLGDFVSRRLMTTHSSNHGDIRQGQLVHMVSGVGLNITSLLAVWMEKSYDGSDTFSLRELPALRDIIKN